MEVHNNFGMHVQSNIHDNLIPVCEYCIQSTYGGRQCDQCADGYYNFEAGCLPCLCDTQGTESRTTCDKTTGKGLTMYQSSNGDKQSVGGRLLFCEVWYLIVPIQFLKINLTTNST